MRTFTVHVVGTEATLPRTEDRVRFVKEGIAWWAYASPLIWFLYHRMWWEAAAYFGFTLVLALGGEALGLGGNLVLVVNLLIQALVAGEANDLRRLALAKKGYRPIAIVHGRDEAEAELRFFANWTGPLPTSAGGDEECATSAVFDRRREGEGAKAGASYPVWPKPNPPGHAQAVPGEAAPDVLGLFPEPHTPR
ncbi:MAG: DUF2628 domain-containing protein [Rhodobiaceae bacterium]|nr:DUF2628 domain-containing protein [Rhodobiaceae bacterium]